MPARELERIRRLEQMQGFFLGATHPPTAYRIEFLKAHYKPEAKVTLSEAELAQLEQELVPLREEMQREVFGLDSLTFRSVFGVSW
jgi:heat shock protein HtpX